MYVWGSLRLFLKHIFSPGKTSLVVIIYLLCSLETPSPMQYLDVQGLWQKRGPWENLVENKLLLG